MPVHPLYIVGPTAVGKSELALAIAERCNGEIVGADAFQVYRGLDLLTAKPDGATLARVPHHLIGEIPLRESFDVAQYRALAVERIAEIIDRGKMPVIAGGTGLYVRALTHGLADLPEPDAGLRSELSAQPLDQLLAQLEELDPVCAAQIDRQNPRRVVRALEVCLLSGRPFSSFRKQWTETSDAKGLIITRERADLYARIDRRTEQMFASGVVEEVRAITEISDTAAQAIGFREICAVLAGEITESECISRIQQQTRNYAKRQLTWFRKEQHFCTLMVGENEPLDALLPRARAEIGAFA